MADQNTSLPIRTENNGDVVARISDGTIPGQQLAIDTLGRITTKVQDSAGNNLTSATAGANRPLHVQAIDAAGNILGTPANPIVTFVSPNIEGAEVNDYNTVASVAAGATSTHDYTVPAGVSHYLASVAASGSGKIKLEIQVEGPALTFTTKFVAFNSTANPTVQLNLRAPLIIGTGLKVRVIRSNLDKAAQDLYSTISGQNL